MMVELPDLQPWDVIYDPDGGRCASIVPDGMLFGSSMAHRDIRKEIVVNQILEAEIQSGLRELERLLDG